MLHSRRGNFFLRCISRVVSHSEFLSHFLCHLTCVVSSSRCRKFITAISEKIFGTFFVGSLSRQLYLVLNRTVKVSFSA